jgi:tRNA pseudouridine13 synthase
MAESDAKKRKVDWETSTEDSDSKPANEGTQIKTMYGVADDSHLEEKDVGITEYVGKHGGFFAIVKRRYADFMVHEIDLNHKIVTLDDLSIPDNDEEEDGNEVDCAVLTEKDHKRMEELSKGNDRKEYHVIEATEDKEERTAVHEAIKKLYPKLTSTTSTEDGKRVIKVMLSKFAGEKQNRKNKWPKGRGDYCKFVLYKENRDTMEAVSVIARLLWWVLQYTS